MWAKTKGFTVVELLIVIVVIAILAAISIVGFTGVQNRANDSVVQGDLASLAKQFELHRVDNGTYPSTQAGLESLKAKVSKASYLVSPDATYNLLPCFRNNSTEYVISATSKSRKRFYIGSDTGTVREYTGDSDWIGANGYYVPCNNLLPGSSMPTGGCSAIGYCAGWRAWLNN